MAVPVVIVLEEGLKSSAYIGARRRQIEGWTPDFGAESTQVKTLTSGALQIKRRSAERGGELVCEAVQSGRTRLSRGTS